MTWVQLALLKADTMHAVHSALPGLVRIHTGSKQNERSLAFILLQSLDRQDNSRSVAASRCCESHGEEHLNPVGGCRTCWKQCAVIWKGRIEIYWNSATVPATHTWVKCEQSGAHIGSFTLLSVMLSRPASQSTLLQSTIYMSHPGLCSPCTPCHSFFSQCSWRASTYTACRYCRLY